MKMYGPYLRKDGRKHVIFIYGDGSRKTKSWPRVLLENHIGRELTSNETVDHIDGDISNDNIENLQILTLSENVKKQHYDTRKDIYIVLECKFCLCKFERRKKLHEYETVIRKKDGPFCSRKCVGKVYH